MIHGKNRIGSELTNYGSETFTAFNPKNNTPLEGVFYSATPEEVEMAMQRASDAFKTFRCTDAGKRADFLEAIADELLSLGDELVKRASEETGLAEARIIGERGRTILQLKLFASLIREGSWVEASIDFADANRKPVPKPDLRRMLQAIGPVVVFTASNFPLAYSTVGGDTASALAAGNPVVVKAHPSHPGTNELVADAVSRAAFKTGMPAGVFSSLNANNYQVGLQLVKHPVTKAVGFTGSFAGGTALWRAANERDEPIPVFSEMGSTNPVVFLEGALINSGITIAEKMAESISLGVGQFCTNPGLMAAVESDALTAFLQDLNAAVKKTQSGVMLSQSISSIFSSRMKTVLKQKGVRLLVTSDDEESGLNKGMPGVAIVDFKLFKENPTLHEEVFGPFSLLVKCENNDELKAFADLLKGQLTTSVFGDENDFQVHESLLKTLTDKAGRIVFNGVPTGVEVNTSMQHGGPFPATTDSRFTSVGPDAIKRFVRPVAYQNAPQSVLPSELQDGNPLGIWRKINGELSKD